MSANLRQDAERVEVNGTLHGALRLWGRCFQCRCTWRPTLVTASGPAGSRCLSLWDKAGRQEDPASLTALSTCPLKLAPLCHTEQGAKQQLALISWCFSETRFAGADRANAADTGAGRSQTGSLERQGPRFRVTWLIGCDLV